MKYKLINSVTKKETICNKVTIDGFDYYMSDEEIKSWDFVGFPSLLHWTPIQYVDGDLTGYEKKIIATTNPNIDIPKVVNEVAILAKQNGFDWENTETSARRVFEKWHKFQETHSNSDEDLIEFAEFVAKYTDKNKNHKGEVLHAKSKYDGAERTTDLLQLWKEQRPKAVYYA